MNVGYCKRKIEARSRNYCCRGKAIIITYSECVSIALRYAVCNAHRPYYIIRGVWLYPILQHYLINSTIFEKNHIEHKMCILIF